LLQNRTVLFIALALSVLVKLVMASPDRLFEAHDLARQLAEDGTFRYFLNGNWNYNYQFPLYPVLIAPGYLTAHGPMLAVLLNIALGTAAAWLVYRLVLRLNAGRYRRVAMMAAIITAFHPFLSYYQVSSVHSFSLDLLLAVAMAYVAVDCRLRRIGSLLLFGAVAGLVLLERPTLIVFGFPMVVRLVNGEFRQLKPVAAVAVLVPALMLGTWLVRNHQVYGQVSYISSTGQNLWIGIQESTEGTAQLDNGDSYYTLLSESDVRTLAALGPLEQDRYFMQLYRQEVTPSLFFSQYVVKLRTFWFSRTHLGVDYGGLIPEWGTWAFRVYSFVLFVLMLTAFHLRNSLLNGLTVSVMLLSLLQAVFYVEMRHRLVAEPIMILAALIVIHETIQRNRTVAHR
jgi:hypothetical protein